MNINNSFNIGEEVCLRAHAKHPEDGRPMHMVVQGIDVYCSSNQCTKIVYRCRVIGSDSINKTRSHQQTVNGKSDDKGLCIFAEEELCGYQYAMTQYEAFCEMKKTEAKSESE